MMNYKHSGALTELTACAWLLKQGYEVFRNVSAHGIADLVAYDPETRTYMPVDVKLQPLVGTAALKQEQAEQGIKLLIVDRDTLSCRLIDNPRVIDPSRPHGRLPGERPSQLSLQRSREQLSDIDSRRARSP
jgi:Holliday junction resolvase-like predicted endonuclease